MIIENDYIITLGVISEVLFGTTILAEDVPENYHEKIEKLKLRKTIYDVEAIIEKVKDIPDVIEDYKLALTYLKELNEEQFEKIKIELIEQTKIFKEQHEELLEYIEKNID